MSNAQPSSVNKDFEGREFAMSEADFQAIKALIYKKVGIALTDQKRGLVYARLTRRLRALGLPNFRSYVDILEGPKANDELSHLINALTTNHTKFFRERHHFDFLRSTAAAEWRARVTRGEPKRLRIWSAGCSTGEEPYTIAMTLAHAFQMEWDWKILATDIDTKVLAHAKRGLYEKDTVRDVPPALKHKYLQLIETGQAEVDAALKSRIRFNRLNLHDLWPMRGPFDVIFCRNVTIYFDPPTKRNLIQRYVEMIKPGGFLFLGHSETLAGREFHLESLGQTIYRKIGTGPT